MHFRRSPWWLVPNILALDAPAVAALWQRFFAHRFAVAVPWAATVALAAAVWAIYLADRCLDSRRPGTTADRHRFAEQHPRAFAVAGVVAGAIAAFAAGELPSRYWYYGAAVAAGVAAYLIFVHLTTGLFRRLPGAKELLVGAGFAAGIAAPLVVNDRPGSDWLPSILAFGSVCWLNCLLIDGWESNKPSASLMRFVFILGIALVLVCFALPVNVGGAIGWACFGLFAVHITCRNRPRAARVLADVLLLTPLAFWYLP